MDTVKRLAYITVCLALLAATVMSRAQGWTTTFYLLFLAVATPGATMWAWRRFFGA